MPGQFLTAVDRKRLAGFPEDIQEDHLIQFFTFSHTDNLLISDLRRNHNRLGFSLQLCAVRYLGFCPENLSEIPIPILKYVANQINVPASIELLKTYGDREQTRTDHLTKILDYLGFRKASSEEFENIEKWLLERALEHDKPSFFGRIRLLHSLTAIRNCSSGNIL